MITTIALLALLLVTGNRLLATVSLPPIIGSNMVLQQGRPLPLWGRADAGEQVRVQFGNQVKTATADALGQWQVVLDPLKASDKPATLMITGSNAIQLTNILVGEVWLCSGQSNMEYSMRKNSKFEQTLRYQDRAPKDELSKADNPAIRLFLVQQKTFTSPNAVHSSWDSATGTALRAFSAAGYFFAKALYSKLHVPVGIIAASVSGSRIEPWMQPGEVAGAETGKFYKSMIQPVAPFAVKGFLWYQGESNCFLNETSEYAGKLQRLIGSWRGLWRDTTLPFYYVQIAPFLYSQSKDSARPHTTETLPLFREAQTAALRIPHTGMVVTTDLVDKLDDLHPPYKWEIGRRLALWALADTYHQPLECSGPLFRRMQVQGNQIALSFTHVGDGLTSIDGRLLNGFTIAGADGHFVPAQAVIKGNQVLVAAPAVKAPVAVRFAWDEAAQPNFFNANGLPAAPFRAGDRFAVPAQLCVQNPRCELLQHPVGIDVRQPRLSWELYAGELRDVEQTAYEIEVASSPEQLVEGNADLWRSGKISSSRSVQVLYKGPALSGRTTCYWRVRSWTNKGITPWSSTASWRMGLLQPGDWQAQWIGYDHAFPWDSISQFSRLSARYLRKAFQTAKPIQQATVYVCGLGLYELFINGQRIGNQVLAPAPADYTKTVLYNTFDVTEQLKQGSNAVGVVLGNGRYFTMRQAYKPQKIQTFGFPKLLLQLEITYADGSREKIVSDNSWKFTADGPIRTNNEYDGEEYDARKEMPGWNEAAFNDHDWLPVQQVNPPGGRLKAQMNEYIRVVEKIQPIGISQLNKDTFILDMGLNMAGWLRMHVQGKKGETVTLRYAETLQPDGRLFTRNLRDAKVTDKYTLKGAGAETWQPAFVYHGFRYVEITGYPGKPSPADFEGAIVSDDLAATGSFESADTTLNQIFRAACNTIRADYKGMPIDCPQRNERMPWLGDRATGAYGESFVFDNAKLYAKWLDDIEDAQTPEGAIPDVAPAFWRYYSDNMTWPGTYILVANALYNQFADSVSISKHYASMKKWMDYMRARYMKNDLVTKDKYGDWCVPPESLHLIKSRDSTRQTDGILIATAYYYHLAELMQRFAWLLGKKEDAVAFKNQMQRVASAFNQRFFHPQTAQYSNNTVTANLLPLFFGMVPLNKKEAVFQNLVQKIVNEHKEHVSSGVIGVQWLLRSLTTNGRPDVAYHIAGTRTYPGWGYMMAQGSTSIWELWNGDTADPSMNSRNHVMLLGDFIIWLYENLAGIQTDAAYPGFQQLRMQPEPVAGLPFVRASFTSVHGRIASEWQVQQGYFNWHIELPANTRAIIYVPASAANEVMESGKPAAAAEGVHFLRMEAGRAVFSIGSGSYNFKSGYHK